MKILEKSNSHGGKREGAGRGKHLKYIKKFSVNPLKKGINEGSSYIEYLRKAALTDNNYKADLERAERKGETSCQRRYIV